MTLLKKLLLFGGIPAAGASAAAVPFILNNRKKSENANVQQEEKTEEFDEKEEIGSIDITGIEVNTQKEEEQIKILKKAGLFCGNSLKDGKNCRVYSSGLRLKVGENVEEGLKISSSSKGKLVLRKSNPYSYGLRLSVEGGEISLEKEGKAPQKLERFESYGLEAEGQGAEKKLHLVKKETHQQGVMRALGLPTNCELPLDGNTREHTLSSTQIKNVHFDGRKEGGATIADSSKNISLKISKSVDTSLFNQGYRFAFSSSTDEITINNGNVIKTNASTEFTIKEWKDEDMVLVRAGIGEKEAEFFGKVGLKCDSSGSCNIEEGKLNVSRGNDKLTKGKKTSGNGIIKLHREQANYINGLKFSIEGEDIIISGNPTDSPIKRLSLFDGYEIVESAKEFYLKRKDEGLAEIVKRLGIMENPSGSVENASEPIFKTNVTADKASKINFYVDNQSTKTTDNKAIEVNGYRTTDTTNYKYGYRFTLKANGDINIGSTKLKSGVSYDFKIREESGKLYLERTIDPTKIIDLVGLSCTVDAGGSTETCTFKEGKANVRHWGDKRNIKDANASTQNGAGKLKLTKDQAGFTDGFMFTVEGGDITFTGGTKGGEEIRMAEFEKYEIQLKDGVWYLYQKKNFMQEKYSDLGINEKCNNEFYSYCELEGGTNAAEKLKFKVKNGKETKGKFSSGAKVLIKLIKDSKVLTGIKVSMKVEGGDDGRHFSVVCKENDSTTLLKLTKEEEEFKIEKIGNDFYLTKAKGEESNETCDAPAAK